MRSLSLSLSSFGSCFEREAGPLLQQAVDAAVVVVWWSVFPGKTNLGRPAVRGDGGREDVAGVVVALVLHSYKLVRFVVEVISCD